MVPVIMRRTANRGGLKAAARDQGSRVPPMAPDPPGIRRACGHLPLYTTVSQRLDRRTAPLIKPTIE